jgi:large subunit ribosomal protein L25
MAHLKLEAQERSQYGNDARKVRNSGQIPAIVYGNKLASSLGIQVPNIEFVKLYRDNGKTNVIDITVGKTSYPCIIQALDIHPVRDTIRHIDFLAVDLKQKVTTDVPLLFVGVSAAVDDGGLLNTPMNTISVEALPENLPHHVEVDITSLVDINDTIKLSQVVAPKGCTIIATADEMELVIASITMAATGIEENTIVSEATAIEDIEGAKPAEKTDK